MLYSISTTLVLCNVLISSTRTAAYQGPTAPGSFIGKAMLSREPQPSTSGKSLIGPAEKNGRPVMVKLSGDKTALQREADNYELIASDKDCFVELLKYYSDPGCIIMEQGEQDLRAHIKEHGPLKGQALQKAAKATLKCVEAVHAQDMVWTELKSENFVVTSEGKVRGIDLESAVPHQDNPLDFTPEACPPEFALAFLCGREPQWKMDYHFDVWSWGIVLYEIASGKPFHEDPKACPHSIAQDLRMLEDPVELPDSTNIDPDVQDLIERCLQVDASKRPSATQLLNHPYFLR